MFMKKKFLVCTLALALPLGAQTRISAKTQARDFDLSGLEIVRPFPVSTFLPPTCAVGEIRFKTNVPAGQNLYTCVSANTWMVQGMTSAFDSGFRVMRTSATTLSIGTDCVATIPCRVRVGSIVHTISAPATLTLSSGVGSVFIYVNSVGVLSVAATPTASVALSCAGCTVEPVTTTYPVDSVPVWSWTAQANQWDTTGLDARAVLSAGRRFLAGTNISLAESGSNVTISSTNFMPTGAAINGNTFRLGGAAPVSATASLLGLGNTISGGSANGTLLGINGPAGFGGDLAHWMLNGLSRFRWTAAGSFAAWNDGGTVNWWGNDSAATGSSFRLAIRGGASDHRLHLGSGTSRNFLQATGLGKVGLGTTAPEPVTADLLVRDATATTGSTQVLIQAGEGQDRDLLQFQNGAGAATSRVTASGAWVVRPEGTRPACAVELRGALWFTASLVGAADKLEACAKTASDTYVWSVLY